jgi:HAE1 family hydrophobic/amphiphilic exporter-1
MARAVIGGLITSTLLTLIVVPVVYTFFDDFGSRVLAFVSSKNKAEGKAHAAAKEVLPGGVPHGAPAD